MTENKVEKTLFATDQAWLDRRREAILEPDLPIVDPHHHLWDRGSRYLLDEVLADLKDGHRILATVFLQCDSMYRSGGDPALVPIGETEFVNGVAAMAASGTYGPIKVCDGIVGFADFFLGAEVDRTLEMHLARGGDRFKGVRHCSVWDADQTIKSTPMDFPKGLLLDPKFRAGFARLARHSLSFDGWLYHTQIPEFADLARAFPDTTMILDHIGAPLAIGAYAGKRAEVFEVWKTEHARACRLPERQCQARRPGHARVRFRLRPRAGAGFFRNTCRDVAALYRDDDRVVRAAALHVRKQFPGGQTQLQLPRAVERLQAAGGWCLGRRKGPVVQGHGHSRLSAFRAIG